MSFFAILLIFFALAAVTTLVATLTDNSVSVSAILPPVNKSPKTEFYALFKNILATENTVSLSTINQYFKTIQNNVTITYLSVLRLKGEIRYPEINTSIDFHITESGIELSYLKNGQNFVEVYNNSHWDEVIMPEILKILQKIEEFTSGKSKDKNEQLVSAKNDISDLLKLRKKEESLKFLQDNPELLAIAREMMKDQETLIKVKEKSLVK